VKEGPVLVSGSTEEESSKMAVWRRTIALSALAVLAAGAQGKAQTGRSGADPALGQAPVLHVNARLVVLDVTATDAAGKPIAGLTATDFKVFEDKVQQRVRSFEPPSSHALPEAVAAEGAAAVFDPGKPANCATISPVSRRSWRSQPRSSRSTKTTSSR
jgi:hypothetical protein